MLVPRKESYSYIEGDYVVHANVTGAVSTDLTNTAALELQSPYGEDTTGYVAGMVAQLAANADGSTGVDISDGSAPIGIFASNYTDSVKSGKADFYYLSSGGTFEVRGNYDTGQTYAVNTKLTVIDAGANKGKLTPATNYASNVQVAMVIEPPSDATADDPMVITLIDQPEGV